jgi:hypothetical protein
MRKLLIICLTILSSLLGIAQTSSYKWGDISQEELTMTDCKFDNAADAAVLYDNGRYYFDRYFYQSNPELRTFYHYQVRIKIFNDAGKKWATVSVPYHGYDEYEDVIAISGFTYNLDENGKVIKSKLKAKNITWQRNGSGLWNCTFALPDVKPGSVIEYTYKIASLDFARLRDWMFQRQIPVYESTLELTSPNFFQFGFFSNVSQNELVTERKDDNLYIQFYNTNVYCNGSELRLQKRNTPAFRKEMLMPDSSRQILKGEFYLVSAITRPSEFSRYNDYYFTPYFKPLLYTTTDEYYTTKTRMQLYTEMLVGYKIILGSDWESFVKKLGKMDDFGKTLLKSFECRTLIDTFKKAGNSEQRLIAAYNYVKNNLKWNGEYRILASSSLEKTFERKSGNSADINMLLINLLNRTGIQAKPVLISTRSHGAVYKEMAFFYKFNHVIASAEIEGKTYLLDATDPLRPYSFLDINDLNGEGLLVGNLDYRWVPLKNNVKSNIYIKRDIKVTPDGKFEELLIAEEDGYIALQKRQKYNQTLPSSQVQMIIPHLKNKAPEGFNVFNLEKYDVPLLWNVRLSVDVIKGDSLLSISPFNNLNTVINSFVDLQRLHPIDFGYEQSLIHEISIPIPEGYAIGSLPQNEILKMQDNALTYSLKTQSDENKVTITCIFEINQAFIPAYFYADLKLFFERVVEKEKDFIILLKRD